MQTENARLISEYQAGDESKIDEIYIKNRPLLVSICSRYSKLLEYDFDDLMTMAHIAFMRVLINYKNNISNFSTYLYIAVRNRIVQYVSIERWGKEDYSKINFHKNFDSIDDKDNYINIKFDNEECDRKIILDNLILSMNILSKREKQMIIERYFAERSLGDIGTDFGISKERVRQIAKIALSKLKESNIIKEMLD